MKLRFLFLGKTRLPFAEEGTAYYRQKLSRFFPLSVEMFAPEKFPAGEAGARALARLVGPQGPLYLCDERGKRYSSAAFAQFLQKGLESGRAELLFAVGGDDGFPPAFRQAAAGSISFSEMTFNHLLMRPLLLEQVYRAMTILKGEPYHRP